MYPLMGDNSKIHKIVLEYLNKYSPFKKIQLF